MKRVCLMLCVLAGCAAALAADPPALVNYQGVLRDASDRPLDPPGGTVNMVFRFYDADTAGVEILIDQHADVSGNAVGVTKGLFNVKLGSGTITDGSGPGTYTSLAPVFRDYSAVWLSIQVGAETLSPRVRIVAAAYSMNASNLGGQPAGNYIDTSVSSQTKIGALAVDNVSGDFGRLAWAQRGVDAAGSEMGGHFIDTNGGSDAEVAVSGSGIRASGPFDGGYFYDSNSSGYAHVGYGDYGVYALGSFAGGYFKDTDNVAEGLVGYAGYGVWAQGALGGGYFKDATASGLARLGYSDTGVYAYGNVSGGYFQDLNSSGQASVANGDVGISAYGNVSGGYFKDADNSGYANVGWNNRGIDAFGTDMGGRFVDSDSSSYAYVGYSTYKIYGNPISTSFVQNHPVEKDTVIVFSAPEGDEVGVYTRGTARLKGGEAHVSLGPTFKWVTNPDTGLTVHLTPIGAWSDLYVASKGTEEIVVRSSGGDPNAAFDYIVYGLRIGFEESSIVQEKMIESYIPSMKDHRQLYERRPDLRTFNALERFKAMQEEAALPVPNLTRANALKAAIHEYDPATDPPTCKLMGMGPCPEEMTSHTTAPAADTRTSAGEAGEPVRGAGSAAPQPSVSGAMITAASHQREAGTARAAAPAGTLFPMNEPVEVGDLVVLDPLHPGLLVRSATAGDKDVVGIAIGAADTTADGALQAPVAVYGVVQVKVDAAYGVVRPGDLLVTSATAGHAMKAPEVIVAGTVIGKALEPLDSGTGVIKVLVMLR